MTKTNCGEITQIIGPVVDVLFPLEELPAIYDALELTRDGDKLIMEVSGHLGGGRVRAIAMGSTDGLKRGMQVKNTLKPICVPVGKESLGRMFNVVGEPIDGGKSISEKSPREPIHRQAPPFAAQKNSIEIFETGIKVIDLICPFIKGGKVGLFGGAGVGKTVLIQKLITNIGREIGRASCRERV